MRRKRRKERLKNEGVERRILRTKGNEGKRIKRKKNTEKKKRKISKRKEGKKEEERKKRKKERKEKGLTYGKKQRTERRKRRRDGYWEGKRRKERKKEGWKNRKEWKDRKKKGRKNRWNASGIRVALCVRSCYIRASISSATIRFSKNCARALHIQKLKKKKERVIERKERENEKACVRFVHVHSCMQPRLFSKALLRKIDKEQAAASTLTTRAEL